MRGHHPGSVRIRIGLLAFLVAACGRSEATAPPAGAGSQRIAPAAAANPTAFAPVAPTPGTAARPLTESGCCVNSWWSSDSSRILYLDRPAASGTTTVYSVALADGQVAPTSSPLGIYDAQGQPVAVPAAGAWMLTALDGTELWSVPAGARALRLSHGRDQVAWSEGSSLPVNVDKRQRSISVARVDSAAARQVTVMTGGDLIGWGLDDDALIVSGTPPGEAEPGIWRLGLDGSAELLFASDRVRSPLVSPDGTWLAFMVAFSGDAGRDGLWAIETSGTKQERLDAFGSYRWRDDDRLLVFPLSVTEAPSLMEFEPATGALAVLLPAELLPGAVANNDWSVSPDGRWLVYLHTGERNLWLIALP